MSEKQLYMVHDDTEAMQKNSAVELNDEQREAEESFFQELLKEYKDKFKN